MILLHPPLRLGNGPERYQGDLREGTDTVKAATRKTHRLMAWAVFCPPRYEYDYLVFADENQARDRAEQFNSDENVPEGKDVYRAIPLFMINKQPKGRGT